MDITNVLLDHVRRPDLIKKIIALIFALWFFVLCLNFFIGKEKNYLRWSGQTLSGAWRNGKQFIIGIAVGYILAIHV